jgi:CRP/FNR family transcriptional regulator
MADVCLITGFLLLLIMGVIDFNKKTILGFFRNYDYLKVPKGTVLLNWRQPVKEIFYLKSGFVKQEAYSVTQNRLVVHIYKPGTFFPILLRIANQANKFRFMAMNEVELYRAPVADVEKWMKENPWIYQNLAQNFAKATVGLIKRLESTVSQNAFKQVSSLLAYLAGRVGKRTKAGIVFEVNLTHQEMANWLGTARETVSRQIELLKKMGLVSYRGHILIVKNLQGLEKTLLSQI